MGIGELLILLALAGSVAGGSILLLSASRERRRLPPHQRNGVAVGRMIGGILMISIPGALLVLGVVIAISALGAMGQP